MDILTQHASTWNLEVLKEPRGFIKIIQFVLAIFAFATTTSVSTLAGLTIKCQDDTKMKLDFSIAYPFAISDSHDTSTCTNNTVDTVKMCCDYSGKSEFYVAVGVLIWLYVIAALVVYVMFDESIYTRYPNVPTVDFIISCVIVCFWLIASSAWADGLRRMKQFATPDNLVKTGDLSSYCTSDLCTDYVYGIYNVLNVSIIFGFLNMAVWGGNLWFLYKDTHWFNGQDDLPNGVTPTSNPTAPDPVFSTTSNNEYAGY